MPVSITSRFLAGHRAQPDAGHTSAPRTQQNRAQRGWRRQQAWAAGRPEAAFHATCQAAESQRQHAAISQALKDSWQRRVDTAAQRCPLCAAYGSLQPSTAAAADMADFVSLDGHVQVTLPHFDCSQCRNRSVLHPVSLGCFPATPSAPTTFFDERLLQWIRALQRHSPLSTSAWTAAVSHMHARNGFAAAKPAVWANFGNALAEWRLLQDLVWSDTSLDIQGPIPGVLLCSVVAVTCNLVLRSLLLCFLACWEPHWECC